MGFAVTVDGRDLFGCYVPRSGVRYGNPLPEIIDAAHWDQMSYEAFQEKDVDYQTLILAAYRTQKHVEAVIAHKRNRQNKSGGSPATSRRRRRR